MWNWLPVLNCSGGERMMGAKRGNPPKLGKRPKQCASAGDGGNFGKPPRIPPPNKLLEEPPLLLAEQDGLWSAKAGGASSEAAVGNMHQRHLPLMQVLVVSDLICCSGRCHWSG